MAAQRPQHPKPLEVLPNTLNEVLVNVGKVFKSAGNSNKCNASIAQLVANNKIPASIEVFNAALDEIEGEILKAKAVVQRDLNQIRASRRQEQRVAPPAPMAIDLSSPKMSKVPTPAPPASQPAAFQPFTGQNSNHNRPVKQESKPVAPFPNMGFDLTVSPEVTPVPVPSPKTVPKAREPKNSPRPPPAAKPAGVPARKETKILPPQPPRSTSQASPMMKKATPAAARAQGNNPPTKQTPVPIPTVPTKQTPVPIPNIPPPKQTPVPIPVPPGPSASAPATVPTPQQAPASAPVSIPQAAAVPPASMPPTTTGAEHIFTDMTFSLAPPETPNGPGANNQNHQPPEIDLVALGAGNFNMDNFEGAGGGGGGAGGGPAAVANMDSSNANDDRIDALFDLGSAGIDNIEMNYDLGDNNGDNSSFNDMYFNMNDDSTTTDQFDGAYFRL